MKHEFSAPIAQLVQGLDIDALEQIKSYVGIMEDYADGIAKTTYKEEGMHAAMPYDRDATELAAIGAALGCLIRHAG